MFFNNKLVVSLPAHWTNYKRVSIFVILDFNSPFEITQSRVMVAAMSIIAVKRDKFNITVIAVVKLSRLRRFMSCRFVSNERSQRYKYSTTVHTLQ